MSRGRSHDWSKRAITDRRGSDENYDVRHPRNSHVDVRPQPSYYGPNFLDSEKGLSSSLAYGDIREPKMPDPYVKRPQPYPPRVQRDYDRYKELADDFPRVRNEYKIGAPMNTPLNDPEFDAIMTRAHHDAGTIRSAANR